MFHFNEKINNFSLTEMKMRYNETINVRRIWPSFRQVREIRKFSVVLVTHMHPTIQHDIFTSQCNHNATSANILTRPKRYCFDFCHFQIEW